MKRAFLAVAAVALLFLLVRAARVGLAGDYLDPVRRITAQDEALYASSAIHMATEGGWLTPRFMGRYALYKPPLLIWTAGLSARLLGVSRLALRLPAALACALSLGLIFLWTAELRSWQAAAAAALLVASNHLWHVLGSFCMTDALLVAFFIAALYALYGDPWRANSPGVPARPRRSRDARGWRRAESPAARKGRGRGSRAAAAAAAVAAPAAAPRQGPSPRSARPRRL